MLKLKSGAAALALALGVAAALADEPHIGSILARDKRTTRAVARIGVDASTPTASAPNAQPIRPTAVILQGTDNARPIPPGWTLSDATQSSVDVAKAQRADLLNKQKELQSTQRPVASDARDRLRDDLQKAREDFLAAQREARDDMKKQIAILKDELQQHRDAIDAARQEAQARARPRKDG